MMLIWMPCAGVWHLSREHVSTTPPVQHRELCTSPLPCGHPASHMCWPSAKTRSLQSSHTTIQDHEVCFKGSWVAASRTLRRNRNFFFSELFLWSLMTSDFASASGKIRAHGEPVILWAPVCEFNSWITGSIVPEWFSTNWQSNSQRENTYIYRKQPSRYVRYLSYKEGHKIPDLSCKFWNSTLANATFYLTAVTKINLLDKNDGLSMAHLWKTLQPDTRSTFNIFHALIWFFMDVLIDGSLCPCVENKIIITIIFTSEVIRISHRYILYS